VSVTLLGPRPPPPGGRVAIASMPHLNLGLTGGQRKCHVFIISTANVHEAVDFRTLSSNPRGKLGRIRGHEPVRSICPAVPRFRAIDLARFIFRLDRQTMTESYELHSQSAFQFEQRFPSTILGQVFDRLGWIACVAGLAISLTLAAVLAFCLKMSSPHGNDGPSHPIPMALPAARDVFAQHDKPRSPI
jgi:hypothetical protein